jgi:hypothetical protein
MLKNGGCSPKKFRGGYSGVVLERWEESRRNPLSLRLCPTPTCGVKRARVRALSLAKEVLKLNLK